MTKFECAKLFVRPHQLLIKADSPVGIQTSYTMLPTHQSGSIFLYSPQYFIHNSEISKFLKTECSSKTYLVAKT